MKLSHLLAGVAAAAVLGGAASAQYTQNSAYGAAATTSATNNNIATRYFVASELDLSAAALTANGSLTVDASAAGAWAGLGSARLTVSAPGGAFNVSVANGDLTGGGAAAAGCQAADIAVTAGGGAGDSSVTFTIQDIGACDDQLNFAATPIVLNGNTLNLNTSLVRIANGAGIDGGAGTTNGTLGAFIQRVAGVRVASTAAAPTRTALLPGYAALNNAGIGSANFRRGLNLVSVAGVPTEVTVNEDLAGTQVTGGNLNSATLAVNFGDTTGFNLANVTLGGSAAGTVAGDTKTFNTLATLQAAGAAGAGGTDSAVVAAYSTPAGGIREQAITATNTVGFTGASNMTGGSNSFTLANIIRAGTTSATFRWVGDGNGVNRSVFRHTGFGATVPTIRVIVANSSADDAFDGEYTIPSGTLTASAGGEIVTNSDTLRGIVGDFGRADITFFFEGTGIRTERFVQTGGGALAAGPED